MTVTVTTPTVQPPAVDLLFVLAAAPGREVAVVRDHWGVNRDTAAAWIRSAVQDPDIADTPVARRWQWLAAIADGDPVPGRRWTAAPLQGIPIPDLDQHDLDHPHTVNDPVTALVMRDLDNRGAQR
jgi:hypothetical protein